MSQQDFSLLYANASSKYLDLLRPEVHAKSQEHFSVMPCAVAPPPQNAAATTKEEIPPQLRYSRMGTVPHRAIRTPEYPVAAKTHAPQRRSQGVDAIDVVRDVLLVEPPPGSVFKTSTLIRQHIDELRRTGLQSLRSMQRWLPPQPSRNATTHFSTDDDDDEGADEKEEDAPRMSTELTVPPRHAPTPL